MSEITDAIVEEPKITLSLSRVLELIWGYKAFGVLDLRTDNDILHQLNHTNHPLYAIETLTTESTNLCKVWRRKEWEMEYANYCQKKKDSEERVKKHDESKSTRMYLIDKISESLGAVAGTTTAEVIADSILRERNETMALAFGAEKERLKW